MIEAQVIGAKVRIDVGEEGSYEGFVHSVDETTRKFTLVKGLLRYLKPGKSDVVKMLTPCDVVSCATGTKMHGLHHFFAKEITNLTVLEQKCDPARCVDNNPKDLSQTSPFQHGQNFSQKFKKDKSRRDPSDEGLRMLQIKPGSENCNSEKFIETSEEQEHFAINPPDIVLVDSFDEALEQAIAYILRQRVVGVAWEGIQVGRFGKLGLIQIGCNKCIYLFDIVQLGSKVFDRGLADIMDSSDILKVVHNCRHFSDALYHQYGVSLVNVFDTQVADAIIYRNEVPDKKLPRQTNTLISCLYEYLDLSPNVYHFHKLRIKLTKDNEVVWNNRPIPNRLIDVAAKAVMYLRELRYAQMERMMEDFIHGVDIYLSCVRDASDEAVSREYSSTALPEMFYERQSRGRSRYRQRNHELDNIENEEQRQIWEDGYQFMAQYEQRGLRVCEHKYEALPMKVERSLHVDVKNGLNTAEGSLGHEVKFTQQPKLAQEKELTQALELTEESTLTKRSKSLQVEKLTEEQKFAQQEKIIPKKGTSKTHESERQGNSKQQTSTALHEQGRFWLDNSGLLSQDDFPQLRLDSHCSSGMSSSTRSTSRDSRFGRGRAASLARNAQLPGVRKPNESSYGHPAYADSFQPREPPFDEREKLHSTLDFAQHDRLQFPTDEELLTSSEIISVSSLNALPSGPCVRVSFGNQAKRKPRQ